MENVSTDYLTYDDVYKITREQFNPEQKSYINNLLEKFGQALLKKAYENHELIDIGNYEEDGWSSCFIVEKSSIMNVFDKTYEKFKI